MARREEPDVSEAEKVRGGEIVLRRRWQRIVFVSGLVGIVTVAAALMS